MIFVFSSIAVLMKERSFGDYGEHHKKSIQYASSFVLGALKRYAKFFII